MTKYNLNERFMPGGSCEERLNPKFGDSNTLNHKLGPRLPHVRETSTSALRVGDEFGRRRLTGLPQRFTKS